MPIQSWIITRNMNRIKLCPTITNYSPIHSFHLPSLFLVLKSANQHLSDAAALFSNLICTKGINKSHHHQQIELPFFKPPPKPLLILILPLHELLRRRSSQCLVQMWWESISQLACVSRQVKNHLLQLLHHHPSGALVTAELAID